jgi:hypothetical protein
MVHFQTRGHIVSWLMRHCPRKAIVRAMNDGKVELLGGFNSIPPRSYHGWILRITSVYNRVWILAITPNKKGDDYAIRELKDVPWASWCGDANGGGLYRGDKPWLYQSIKERAVKGCST